MRFEIMRGEDEADYTLLKVDPNPEDIRIHLETLRWKKTTFIRMWKDQRNWLEYGGSELIGFKLIFCEGNRGYIAKEGPRTLEQAIIVLQDFCLGGNDWMELFQ